MLPWRDNVFEAPVETLNLARFDCVLYQSRRAYENDRLDLLTPELRALPKVYLEHDPPQASPTDTLHVMQDPNALLVHVTPFNALMWDSGITPTRVIEHGVALLSPTTYRGTLERGVVVVNHIVERGRRLGADLYLQLRQNIPLDLVGMGAERAGGLGEIDNTGLPDFMASYRFFFNPIRYTSLGLSVIEAMMVGLPVIGLATTEMSTVIENGVAGCVDTRPERLIEAGRELLADRNLAHALGEGARRIAHERFNIDRFAADWDRVLRTVAG